MAPQGLYQGALRAYSIRGGSRGRRDHPNRERTGRWLGEVVGRDQQGAAQHASQGSALDMADRRPRLRVTQFINSPMHESQASNKVRSRQPHGDTVRRDGLKISVGPGGLGETVVSERIARA
jgi:hypothetical protein